MRERERGRERETSALTAVVLRRPRLLPLYSVVLANAVVLSLPLLMPLYSDVRAYCRCTQSSALNAVVIRRLRLMSL